MSAKVPRATEITEGLEESIEWVEVQRDLIEVQTRLRELRTGKTIWWYVPAWDLSTKRAANQSLATRVQNLPFGSHPAATLVKFCAHNTTFQVLKLYLKFTAAIQQGNAEFPRA
jgi:hypothetical protein